MSAKVFLPNWLLYCKMEGKSTKQKFDLLEQLYKFDFALLHNFSEMILKNLNLHH